jgi:hypothetical protein
MTDPVPSATKNLPSWWTEKHASDWDRVKSALERDWEQTKADVAPGQGHQLNQSIVDTVKQSVGSAPIPAADVKTHPTEPQVALEDARVAHDEMEAVSVQTGLDVAQAHSDISAARQTLREEVGEARAGLAKLRATAGEELAEAKTKVDAQDAAARVRSLGKIAAAQDKASESVAKGQQKIREASARRDEAVEMWRDAEQVVRFGYSVRSRFPSEAPWNDQLERQLRGEWDGLETGHSWQASRHGVRRGWDHAGRPG